MASTSNSEGGAALEEPIEEAVDESLILKEDKVEGEMMESIMNGPPEPHAEARPARSPSCPKTPTAREIAQHNLTHAMYRSWCPFCVAGRRPNTPHRRVMEERTIPLLVGDFAYVRTTNDDESLTVFVSKVLPQRVMFAMALDQKGANPENVTRLAKFIKNIGLTRFAYRSDQERAVIALIDSAALEANRQAVKEGTNEAIVAASENSSVGESASNGAAERAVQSFEDMTRTTKLALESRMGVQLPIKHPVMFWLVEHNANIITKYHVGTDGKTGYSNLHGRECREKLVEFGERVMFYVPRKLRAKLDPRWRYGIWLGRALHADESFVATSDGKVTRARAIVRLVEGARWVTAKILGVQGKPGDKFSDGLEKIEEDIQPHLGLDDQPEENMGEDVNSKAPMRMIITLRDLEKYGFTKNCPRCNMHQLGKVSGVNHSEECRLRIYQSMRNASDSKLGKAKHLGMESKDLLDEEPVRKPAASEPLAFEPVEIVEQLPVPNRPVSLGPKIDDQDIDDAFLGNDATTGLDDHNPVDVDFDRDREVAEQVVDMNEDSEMSMDADMDMGDDGSYDAMVSTLQTLGVSAVNAVRFSKSVNKAKPATTLIAAYGRGGLSDLANRRRRSLNVKGLAALDLRTYKPSGGTWDFTKKSDQKEALGLVDKYEPEFIIGSPPCTDWSSWNIGINHRKMDPMEVERRMVEARVHLKFVVKLYKKQLAAGRHFLHEHPAGAKSWEEPYMVQLLENPSVKTVVSHQCEYGLTSPDEKGVLQPVKKPTRWMSSSERMISRLSRRCSGTHTHQHLVGGRAAAAAFYPND